MSIVQTLLSVIEEAGRPLSLTELSERTGYAPKVLGPVLTRLEEANEVRLASVPCWVSTRDTSIKFDVPGSIFDVHGPWTDEQREKFNATRRRHNAEKKATAS